VFWRPPAGADGCFLKGRLAAFLAPGLGMVYHGGMTTLTGIEIPAAPIPNEEEKHQMTLEALGDIDEGHLIRDQEMQLWFDALEAKLASKSR